MPTLPPHTPRVVRVRRPLNLNATLLALLICAACALSLSGLTEGTGAAPLTPPDAGPQHPPAEAYGKLPLSFEANRGQVSGDVRFVARGAGYSLFLTPTEAVFALRRTGAKDARGGAQGPGHAVLRMGLRGASGAPVVEGLEELPGRVNYFEGADPAGWHSDVPLYSKVHYRGVYPGIDLVYYGNQGQLEYDFNVAPGADPSVVGLTFEGAERLAVEDGGDLLLTVAGGGEVRLRRPFVYQPAEGGGRREVEARYEVSGHAASFALGAYDASLPLVIDPVLVYSTYLGSTLNDAGAAIAVDAAGHAYVTGWTGSLDFPTTGQTFVPAGGSVGAFVTKLNPAGSALVYSTIIGGAEGTGIAVDAAGSAYVTGKTNSADFPTVNPIRFKTRLTRSTDGGAGWAQSEAGITDTTVVGIVSSPAAPQTFFARSFSSIFRSTNAGANWTKLNTGTGTAGVNALAVDPSSPSVVYVGVAGVTSVHKSNDGGDTFAPHSSGLVGIHGLAVHPQDSSTLYAGTDSGIFKSTDGGVNWTRFNATSFNGAHTFVFDPTDARIVYAASTGTSGVFKTTDGGATWTHVNTGLPLGHNASTVMGLVMDPHSPSTLYAAASLAGVFKTTDGGANWAPVSGLFGGPVMRALAVAPTSPATVYAGTDRGSVFKTTDGGATWTQVRSGLAAHGVRALAVSHSAPSTVLAGLNVVFDRLTDGEGFVAKLSPAGNALVYSTFLGGSGEDAGRGVAVDASGRAVVVGATRSGDYPLKSPLTPRPDALGNAFVTKLDETGGALVYSSLLGGDHDSGAYAVANDAAGNTYVTGETRAANFPVTAGAFRTTLGNPSAGEFDAFVTKLAPDGSALVYSTYLGGSARDVGRGVAVDAAGNAYVAGSTLSSDFPLKDPLQAAFRGGRFEGDGFVTKLNPAGTALVFSTYLGGSDDDPAHAVAVGPDGAAVVVGATWSDDFPLINSLRSSKGGLVTGYVAKFGPSRPFLVYSTYLGGRFSVFNDRTIDEVRGVALDPVGHVYVTGMTHSSDFPVTPGSFQPATRGGTDAFVAKLDEPIFLVFELNVVGDVKSGFRVSLTGDELRSITTDFTGRFNFEVRRGGNYTITVSKAGFDVTPRSITYTNISTSQMPEFTATHSAATFHTVGGRIAEPDGTPVPGVTVVLGGSETAVAVTDSAGNYSFAVKAGGSFTVTPVQVFPFVIDPPSRSVNNISANFTADFSAQRRSIVVTNTNDSGPGSLRQAILDSNAAPGRDRIAFDIPGTGVRTISPASALPGATGPVVIDGTTQPGFSGTPVVEIEGSKAGSSFVEGLALRGGNSVVRGLAVNNFANGIGIRVSGDGNVVEGNFVGLDPSGTVRRPNQTGVSVTGIDNLVGGTTPAARNVISGNSGGGVGTSGSNNRVKGNYIGTDASGATAIGNGAVGVSVSSITDTTPNTGNVVGGTEPGAGNVISATEAHVLSDIDGVGVLVRADGTLIQGNLIGTDASGTIALPNGAGVEARGVNSYFIGGSAPGAGNLISGNRIGVRCNLGQKAVIQGNRIGTDASGLAPLPNTVVGILAGTTNLIGGEEPGAGNLIAFNATGVGINQAQWPGNNVRGNRIYSNAGLGIDLGFVPNAPAVTPNDPGDADDGPNGLQNFPLLTSVASGAGGTQVQGTLNSKPGTQFRIDFYSNAACDPSGHGEGASPFGSTQVTTDSAGNASFSASFPAQLPAGRVLTATATDPSGSTSEFSPCDAASAGGSVEFAEAEMRVSEDIGTLVVRVLRVGGSRGTLGVNYATGGGTATPGADYTPASGTLTFAEGETEKTFAVPVVAGDASGEPEETVLLSLSGTAQPDQLGSKARARLRIQDAVSTSISISAADAQVAEGDSGQKNVSVRVSLSALTGHAVTVEYATQDGTARLNRDYTPASGTLTFEPGEESKTVELTVLGDATDEPDETFVLNLRNASGAQVGRSATVTITDDDPLPSVSVNDVTVSEGAAGARAVFSVRLSAHSARSVTVNYATADNTAGAGSDYTAASGTLTFEPGQTLRFVEVPVLADNAAEQTEFFFLHLSGPVRATLDDSQGAAFILDSSNASSVIRFSSNSYEAAEPGGSTRVTVTRTGDASGAARVSYRTVSRSASERSDFTAAAGTLFFGAGETAKSFDVLVNDDAYEEGVEWLELVLFDPAGGALGGPNVASLSVESNDAADGPSPVGAAAFDTRFFVSQHYHDFFSREPDAPGLAHWTNVIESCGADQQCREVNRINVSGAFFLSIEFQQTGYLVERTYKAAFGDATGTSTLGGTHTLSVPIIRLEEFLPDTQRIGQGVVVNQGDWQGLLEANKQAYFLEFVQRARFASAFPASMTPTQFVGQLNERAGNPLDASERRALVDELTADNSASGRASVLRKVAEDPTLEAAEKNRAFVLMQYFGYLRRNPNEGPDTDYTGYDFWLGNLNRFDGNFVQAELVKAFITSAEYQRRFGR